MGNGVVVRHDALDEVKTDARRVGTREGVKTISQALLHEYLRAKETVEKLHKTMLDALENGAAVADGSLDAGIFLEMRKSTDWRGAYIAVAGEEAAKALVADTLPKPYRMFRVFESEGKAPKGQRIAPTPDGQPLEKEASAKDVTSDKDAA